MKHRPDRNPYGNTKKRRAALAFMAARGIAEPRPVYPTIYSEVEIHRLNPPVARRLTLVS